MKETNEIVEQNTELAPIRKLYNEGDDITNQIIAESDPDKVKDLTDLFNLNLRKKEIARINKLNNLLEIVDDEVIARITTEPETFDNEVLLKYMNSTQQAINGIKQTVDEQPLVQINNNEIHIEESGLNQESRKKVLEAVMNIINSAKQDDAIEAEFEVDE